MKNLFVIILLIGSVLNSAGLNLSQKKSQDHTFNIHKNKRLFLKPNNRQYLKDKPSSGLNANTNKDVEELIKRGLRKDSMMDFKAAYDEFMSALRIKPKNSEANYYLGLMKFQMEDFANALPDFDAAIANDSLCVESYFVRGNAKFELKDYQGAIEDYKNAIKLNPEDYEVYYNRAIANYYLGNEDAACKDLESALKYKDNQAYIAFGEICR